MDLGENDILVRRSQVEKCMLDLKKFKVRMAKHFLGKAQKFLVEEIQVWVKNQEFVIKCKGIGEVTTNEHPRGSRKTI